MPDAMVTARMPQAKKEAGARVLEALGTTASQFINDAYDYLVAHGASPFNAVERQASRMTPERLAAALAEVEDMCLPADNRFTSMADDEIRRERLARRGLSLE